MDRVRVLRILEYEGPRSWIEASLSSRSVKGELFVRTTPEANCIIREAIIGETPTILGGDNDK